MATLISLIEEAVNRNPCNTAIRSIISGDEFTYDAVRINALRVKQSLEEEGVQAGDRVAILMGNNPGFIFSNLGILYSGAVSVPINQRLLPREMLSEYLGLVKPHVILCDEEYLAFVGEFNSHGSTVLSIEDCLRCAPSERVENVSENDSAAIIFSSGTSQETIRSFKAIELTHGNLASNIEGVSFLRHSVPEGSYMTGIAGQWHSFEYMVQMAMLCYGRFLHFTDIKGFMKNGHAKQIRPACMIMIPEIANSLKEQIMAEVRKSSGDKQYKRFSYALECSKHYLYDAINAGSIGISGKVRHLIADCKAYSKIRGKLAQKFGGRLPFLIGGSAPLDLDTQLFFYAIGWPIYQGYGLTETSPVVSVNDKSASRYRFGSSGRLLPNVKVRIANPYNMSEEPEGKEGLILVSGPNVFKGYYGEPELSQRALASGWFNTEDLGYLKDGFLYVTGRKNRLIVLRNGEKINPAPIEAFYENRDPIYKIVVVGEGKDCAKALVIPKQGWLEAMLEGGADEASLRQDISVVLSVRWGIRAYAIVRNFYEKRDEFMTQGTNKLKYNVFMADEEIKALVSRLYR